MKLVQKALLALATATKLIIATALGLALGGVGSILGAGVLSGAQTATNLATTIAYTGIVVDSEGRPVPGAKVDYYRVKARAWAPGEYILVQSTTTETNGRFELRLTRESTVVVVSKTGLAPSWRRWSPKPGATERFVLPAPGTLAGVVVDEANQPVPDAEVWVSTAWNESLDAQGGRANHYLMGLPARRCFSTRTGAEGRFRLEGFPTNAAADLSVRGSGKVLPTPTRDQISPKTLPYRTGLQEIKLVLVPAGSIEGRVVTADQNQPVPGARLSLMPDRSGARASEPVWAGADGRFAFGDLVGGTYKLRAVIGTNALPEWVADALSVTVETGQTNRAVQVPMSKGGFLSVMVRGKNDQQPLFEATVNAYRLEHQAAAPTDRNGVALFRLPAGEYRVSASEEGWRATTASRPQEVRAGQTNQVELELAPPSRITGVVRDPGGAPVPGLVVKAFPEHRAHFGEVKTDAQGRFAFDWTVESSTSSDEKFALLARDLERNWAVAVDLEEDTKTLELRLEPGLTLAGRVENSEGTPLPFGSVTVYLWTGSSGSVIATTMSTNAQGRFEVTGLPANRRYSVDVSAKGYGSAGSSSRQAEGETNRLELDPFVLQLADRPLAGRVVNTNNEPVASAYVSVSGQGQPDANVRTDAQGFFAFEGVCEGTLRVSASQQTSYANVTVEAGDTNVVLILGARSSGDRRTPSRPALLFKPLPDLAPLGLAAASVPAGKPLLLCLFDCEQRPSRRCLRLLSEQYEALRQKGLTVAAVQATPAEPESLKAWQQSQPVPFPVGWVTNLTAKPGWTASTGSLPWLILTDRQGRVTAEGFALEELEAKIKALLAKSQ